MDPHDFGLLDPHPESVFKMRIPYADTEHFVGLLKGTVQQEFSYVF
jgi:hypothetical protein